MPDKFMSESKVMPSERRDGSKNINPRHQTMGQLTSRPRTEMRPDLVRCRQRISLAAILLLCMLALESLADSRPNLRETIGKSLKSMRSMRKLELAKSSAPINEWLLHQVAPVVATKLIDNVLQKPNSKTATKKAKSESLSIDTQALADKIVDKLADSLKKRKAAANKSTKETELEQEVSVDKVPESESTIKGASRQGKSLVGDSMQQVVQNLLAKENRRFFGRAIERAKPRGINASAQHQQQHHQNQHHQQQGTNSAASSAHLLKETLYDMNLLVSTDSSQLDDNPVVLRAEHGQNLTTAMPPTLMSSTNKLIQKQRGPQKYVHTNRHQQQHLAPKPWLAPNGQRRPTPQQSPYQLPVTSDINIVQAPSSPPPPSILKQLQSTTTEISGLDNEVGSTNSPVVSTTGLSFFPQPTAAVQQLGPNKFKIHNRYPQPNNVQSMSPSGSWYSSNRNQLQGGYSPHSNHRFSHNHPLPTTTSVQPPSTTSTTTSTTTTTTTTTPEPPPQTETMMPVESMDNPDQEIQHADSSSIISSVAHSVLDSMGHAIVDSMQSSGDQTLDNQYSTNSSYSSLATKTDTKRASSSATTARHSILSAEAIPTALGAPLYHLTRANYTTKSILGPPPPRRLGSSPSAKMAAEYLQKGLMNLSTNIFRRQSKGWVRKLGFGSMLLSALYGAAVLANPRTPIPTSALEILQLLTRGRRRRGSRDGLLMPLVPVGGENLGPTNQAILDANVVNMLYQQPQLLPLIEHLIQQEQLQQQLRQQSQKRK